MSRHYRRVLGVTALAAGVSFCAVGATLRAASLDGLQAAQPAAAAGITPAQAAPFMGDWTVVADSPMGPATFYVSIKADAGKVSAEVSSDQQPKVSVTDLSKDGTSMVLKYAFDYQGMPLSAVITLTPDAEKLKVDFAFADGQFTMSGVGTKAKS